MQPLTKPRPAGPKWDPSAGKGARINSSILPRMTTGGGPWPRTLWEHAGTRYFNFQDGVLKWTGAMRMTVYGQPRALHPADSDCLLSLDVERARGFRRCIVDGERLAVQGDRDPMPGHLVTQTAHVNADYPPDSQRRYHDPGVERYLSVPLGLMVRAHQAGLPCILGAKAAVWDLAKANWHEMPVLDIDYFGGGCLSQRVFREWSYGYKPDTTMPLVEVHLWPGVAAAGYELQEWNGE